MRFRLSQVALVVAGGGQHLAGRGGHEQLHFAQLVQLVGGLPVAEGSALDAADQVALDHTVADQVAAAEAAELEHRLLLGPKRAEPAQQHCRRGGHQHQTQGTLHGKSPFRILDGCSLLCLESHWPQKRLLRRNENCPCSFPPGRARQQGVLASFLRRPGATSGPGSSFAEGCTRGDRPVARRGPWPLGSFRTSNTRRAGFLLRGRGPPRR